LVSSFSIDPYRTYLFELHPSIRADLLPTLARIRKSGMLHLKTNQSYDISRARSCIEHIMQATGIDYEYSDSIHYGDCYISWESGLIDKRFAGAVPLADFLEYPQCCVERAERLEQTVSTAKEYWTAAGATLVGCPDELLYALHTPCESGCEPSFTLGASIRALLKATDPEAGDFLVARCRLLYGW
jgi:hypothetical protein